MKRLIALLMAAALLLTASLAFAQEIVLTELEDGCQITLTADDDVAVLFNGQDLPAGFVRVIASRSGAASVLINIQPDELLEGISMADLSDENIEIMKDQITQQYEDAIVETKVTEAGNTYLYVQSNEESDIRSCITLYEGFMIELIQARDDFGALSEADEAFARDILQGIWIVEAE